VPKVIKQKHILETQNKKQWNQNQGVVSNSEQNWKWSTKNKIKNTCDQINEPNKLNHKT
jgi:hypothetical protein